MDKVVTPTHMCLPFSEHDGGLEMNVNDHEQLLVTGVEEQMFGICEQYVCACMINRFTFIPSNVNLPIFCEPIGDWYREPFGGFRPRLVTIFRRERVEQTLWGACEVSCLSARPERPAQRRLPSPFAVPVC